ncbi:MAG: hypothetical protein AB8H80_03520 [Planctomycetota bacterium]
MATKKNSTKKRGRKPDAGSKSGKIRELLKSGMKPADIAEKVGCSLPLVYNVKARASGGGGSAAGGKKRKVGRPAGSRSAATSGGTQLDGLDAVLSAVKESERERMALRRALEQIQKVIANAID